VLSAPPLKLKYNVQGVDDTLVAVRIHFDFRIDATYRNVTQNGQQDVDEEIGIASTLKEDT
jgi:hypothetical protein